MVKVEAPPHVQGPFFRTFATLYEELSSRPFPRVLAEPRTNGLWPVKPMLLDGIGPLVLEIYSQCKQPAPDAICVDLADPHTMPEGARSNRVLVAFSGGKDSVAAVLKLKAVGYKPELYFVRGINKSYHKELEYALNAAGALGLTPITVGEVTVTGKGDFVENPVKNFLILSMMFEYGRRQGIYLYATGSDAHLGSTVNPEYDLSDAKELYSLANKFYWKYMPSFDCINPIESATDAFYTIWKHAPEILRKKSYLSCILPEFRKPNVRKANLAKGIELEASRCGSCNKCAKEYLHDVIFGIRPFDRAYAERCVENIRKRDYQENVNPNETFLDHEAVDVALLREHVAGWENYDPATESFLDALEKHAPK